MWGIWIIVLAGMTVGALFLFIGLFLFASPVIAVLIGLIAAAVASAVFVSRRGAEHADETTGAPGAGARAERSPRPQNPRSGGAPASGEGAPPAVESGTPQL
jgi:hypothetical protein